MNARRRQLRSGQADRAARRCVPFGAGRWPQPPVQRARLRQASPRRGTVLIMVVALLSILFVVGAAFLSTVTFESRSISSAEKTRVRNCVLDALLGEVRAELRKGFLGKDARPWNSDFDSDIGNDIYGEVPGIHPLIASTDPYQNTTLGNKWVFYQASDLELTVRGQRLDEAIEPTGAKLPGTNLVIADLALGASYPAAGIIDLSDEANEGDSNLNAPLGTAPLYRRDADGDGVWDGYERRLPIDRYAPAIRGGLAGELRAEDALADELDDIYYALRIIPHGAMVNLSHAHDTILRTLLKDVELDTAEPIFLEGPFSPVSEEADLRRRFLLPPLKVPMTDLQERQGQIPESLYYPFVPGGDLAAFGTGDLDARWWPIDTGTNGGDIDDVADPWLNWMNPSHADFAKRHLLTTISYDDQLMRIGRANPDTDWIDDLLALEASTAGVGLFGIDQWPYAGNPEHPLNGRLKVSLPSLVEMVLVASDVPGLQIGIDGLADPTTWDTPDRKRFIYTIQDTFLLMLRNVADMDGDGDDDDADRRLRAKTAAALTANLIDFADSNALPSRIPAVYEDGTDAGLNAYGLERQPFISEVVATIWVAQEAYAVELHNPHSAAIPLGDFWVGVNGSATIPLAPLVSLSTDDPLYIGDDANGLLLPPPDLPVSLSFGPDDKVQLFRRVTYPPPVGQVDVVVDQIIIPGVFPTVGNEKSAFRQRDTENSDGWLVPVPRFEDASVAGLPDILAHTLSERNAGVNVTDAPDNARPVQIDFANTGDLTAAFPTTGSLLLLSRFANVENVSTSGFSPFTASLGTDCAQIDNGHMPVFDTSTNGLASAGTGPFDLHLPWGQLMFDYFTALPMAHTYDRTTTAPDPVDMTPTVDQDGLRVHGRVDINSAPWTVLAGLPMVPETSLAGFPAAVLTKIDNFILLDPNAPTPIGPELAQSIVAYREEREINLSGSTTGDFGDGTRLRQGTGFLTVGELANVQHGSATSFDFRIDSGAIDGTADEDFIEAAAVLVALGDWVTTRSHVFTIYGTLRGAGSKSLVDRKAIRFQETVDRMPCMFSKKLPKRIGQRIVSGYTNARGD